MATVATKPNITQESLKEAERVRLAYLKDPVFGTPELDNPEANEMNGLIDQKEVIALGSINFKEGRVVPTEEAKNLVEYKVDPDSINIDRRGPQDEVYEAQQQILGQRGQGGGLLGNLFAETFTQNPAKMGENIVVSLGEGVKESTGAVFDLLKTDIVGKRQEQPKDPVAQQEANKKTIEESQRQAKIRKLESEINRMAQHRVTREPIDSKRVRTNELLNLQKSFEGSVDQNGNIKEYYQVAAAMKTSEEQEVQRRAQRQKTLAMATKRRGCDPFDMSAKDFHNRAGENINHALKAAG